MSGMQKLVILSMLFKSRIDLINGIAETKSVAVMSRQNSFVSYSDEHGQTTCASEKSNQTFGARSLIECSLSCQKMTECVYFNWHGPERKLCELYFHTPTKFEYTKGCTLYSVREWNS